MALKYKRILLKISGEALGGEKGMGFDEPTMDAICGGVKKAHELGVQIGISIRRQRQMCIRDSYLRRREKGSRTGRADRHRCGRRQLLARPLQW